MKKIFRNMSIRSLSRRRPENNMAEKGEERQTTPPRHRKSEKGVVLILVLVLCAVSLAIITALMYMITMGTQMSGMQKRYRTALEAGVAASDIITQVIAQQGDDTAVSSYLASLKEINAQENATKQAVYGGLADCEGQAQYDLSGTAVFTQYKKLAAKLMTPTTSWTNCVSSFPTGPDSYDLTFQLGTDYHVYAKVVDTVEGFTRTNGTAVTNTLRTDAVVSNSQEIAAPSRPYQYTVEVDVESTSPSAPERAKLQFLYEY
jgi:hypothetical protein